MRRCLNVWLYGECIGQLSQDNEGYLFDYCQGYKGPALSLSLPINGGPFRRPVLHPYFASLAPEGWLKKRYSRLQKLDEQDLFGLLLQNGENLLGAVQLTAEGKR